MKSLIQNSVKKLIKDVPANYFDKTETIDLVLDGGAFNGSYQIGCLYFLKEMENQKMIKIDKISCCSVGCLCALLYYINRLDLAIDIYDYFLKDFKKNKSLEFLHHYIDTELHPLLPVDLYITFSNKFYLTYYDLKKQKKITRKKYKSNDNLLECVKRATFLPYFINGNLTYKKKYIDGLSPYIFDNSPAKKIIYIELFGIDKINYAFSIKNEKNNCHRILTGVLDIYLFFIKQTTTLMCSYVNDWDLLLYTKNKIIRYALEKIIVKLFIYYIYILKHIPEKIKDSIISKIVYKFFGEIYSLLFDYFCI
jgi:hypothetical protein